MENQNDLRNKVKAKLGMSQIEAADQIPIEYVYFSKWLNDKLNLGHKKIEDIQAWLKD